MSVAAFAEGVTVESVPDLYARRAALDIDGYYEAGERNPYDGLCRLIPARARHYVMVHEKSHHLDMARLVMKGLAKRRKVREAVCEKHEINYRPFAPAGRIVVLWA